MRRPNKPDKQYLSLELKRFYNAFSTIITPDKQVLSIDMIEQAQKILNDRDSFGKPIVWLPMAAEASTSGLSVELLQAAKDRLINEPDVPVTWQVQGELPNV